MKLVCPRELLHERVEQRDAERDRSPWAYEETLPDRHALIDRFFDGFSEVSADVEIDTSRHPPDRVLSFVLAEIEERMGRGPSLGPEALADDVDAVLSFIDEEKTKEQGKDG